MKISVLADNSLVSCKEQTIASLPDLASYIKGLSWSPILFKGGYRKEENFREAHFLGLDVDDGLSINEARTRLTGMQYIIAPTKSHQVAKKSQAACDRFRVIIPLARPIAMAKDFKDAVRTFCATYLPEADKNALDAARFFYPSPHDPIIEERGQLYNFSRRPLPLGAVEFLKDVPKEGAGFNNGLFAATAELYKSGYEMDEIQTILYPALMENGWSEYSTEDLTAMKSAMKSVDKEKADQEAAVPWFVRHLSTSELIYNAEDNTHQLIYNKKTHDLRKVDPKTILRELGRKEGNAFIKNGRSFFFQYKPLDTNVFLTGKSGEPIFNSYTPPDWLFNWYYKRIPVEPSDLPKVYNDLFKFFMDYDDESFEYLLDWLANGLRKQNLTYLCAVATQGVGKNALGAIMAALFGSQNSRKVSHQVFKSNFNAALKNKRFIFVDEILLTDDEAIDRLKDMVNTEITIEEKGKDSETVSNYANVYLATNRADGIPLEVGDRRFSIVNFTDTPLVKVPALLELITSGAHTEPNNVSRLGRYLWNRKVTRNMLVPFKSAKTLKVVDAQFKNWERLIIKTLKEDPGVGFTFDELRDKITDKYRINPPGDFKFIELAKKCPDTIECEGEKLIGKGKERLPEV